MTSSIRTSNIRTIALAALVTIASLSQTLHAQTLQQGVRVNVPFSFDYGTKHFAHGVYVLGMNSQSVLIIRNNATVATAMAQTSFDPTPTRTSVVVFRKYGDRYFLDEVRMAGTATNISVLQSREEKHAARELAMRGENATQVALALLPLRPFGN
jgi:hypothetical protein